MKKRVISAALALCVSLTVLPPGVLALESGGQRREQVLYGNVTDIIEPRPPRPEEGEGTPGEEAVLPKEEDLQTNEDFKPYDPYYPKKSLYGGYTLRVPELKGRLTFSANRNQVIGTLFAPGTTQASGHKDAEKNWENDTGLCFAAASSNLIAWYLEQYLKQHPEDAPQFVTSEHAIFDRFRKGWVDEGGEQKEALSWYFTGGFPNGTNTPSNGKLNGTDPGGYLRHKIPNNNSDGWSITSLDWKPKEVFSVYGSYLDNQFPFIEEVTGYTGNGAIATHQKFSEQILRQLHYGACTISLVKDRNLTPSGHAITLWGADYNVDTGLITGIHVTDSDDYGKGIFRVGIRADASSNGEILMEDYSYIAPGEPGKFTRIKDSIVLYAPGVVIENKVYDGPAAVIGELIPGEDGSSVTVRVTNIKDRTLEYGYSYDRSGDHVVHWQTDPVFHDLEADQYYFFARVKAEEGMKEGGLSQPTSYRIQPSVPEAQEEAASLSLGTESLRPYGQTGQYLWYGTERGEDGMGEETPILWRVLDTTASSGEAGVFLLSEKLFGAGTQTGPSFDESLPYENSYMDSFVRQWCRRFEDSHLSVQEQQAILPTTKTDRQFSSQPNGGITFGEVTSILFSDRVFAPSAEELLTTLNRAEDRKGWYQGRYADYWLRSPEHGNGDYVGFVSSDGQIRKKHAMESSTLRPGLNLDSDKVLYTAAVGQGQFTDQLGLERIQRVQSADFRLVLKEGNRAFRVSEQELTGQAGGGVTLTYEGAYTGSNEYLSVILLDVNKTPIYYGKIAQNAPYSGTVQIRLPADLEEGSYTMKVFNEAYYGERRSGTASEACDLTLTIRGKAVLKPVEEVELTLAAPVTGEAPQKAAATLGGTVTNTVWTPDHPVFRGGTHYDVSIDVSPNADYILTSDTQFRLNGHPVAAAGQGEKYTVTYTGFADTEADPNGGEETPDNGGEAPDNGEDKPGGGETPDNGEDKPGGGETPDSGEDKPGGGETPDSGENKPGGGGTPGGGGAPGVPIQKPETTQGPDGSKIETVLKPDGTRVETVTWPNGDKSVTETRKDGSVSIQTERADGTAARTSKDKNGAVESQVVLSQKAVRESERTKAPIPLPIPPVLSGADSRQAPVVKVETETKGKAVITIPVTGATPGTVGVLIHPDGTQEIIRKSVNTETGVTLSVEHGAVVKIMENTRTFSDIDGHWAKDSIDFVASHELYSGTSPTTFSPDMEMTRSMLAVVLYHLEGSPDIAGTNVFQDIREDTWYTRAVDWAAERKIVSGYDNGKFGPEDPISREQLTVMLYRYVGSPAHHGTARSFQDADQVSAYAREAVDWAVETGIISGTGAGTLNPQGVVTRAQAAAMLVRLMEQIR